jgi:molybdenum cofactor cytidylyltransferase
VRVGAVILAAGQGSRLGGVAKALLEHEGQTFLARIAAACAAVEARVVVVVAAPHGEQVSAATRALGLAVAVNPAPERGMASSVVVGLAALPAELDGALVWPVDIPEVTAATLGKILAVATPSTLVSPRHGGRRGHPLWIGARLWDRVPATVDSGGLRSLTQVPWLDVTVPDPQVLVDVDTPSDWARMKP